MADGNTPKIRSTGAWLTLAVLTAMNLLNYVDRFILAAVLRPVGEELSLSDTQKGWLSTAFLLSYTVFSPLVCLLEERWPRRYLLALGVGLWSLATCGMGWVHSFGEALFVRALLGIGEATYAVIAPTLISDLFPRERRNRALTIFYLAIPVGAALGYKIGGAIFANYESWRAAFYVVGLPGLLIALVALVLHEPPRGATEEVSDEARQHHAAVRLTWGDYLTLLRNWAYLYNTLGMAFFTFALGGLQYWTPNFLETHRDLSIDLANERLAIVVFASSLLGTPLGGLIGEWLMGRMRGGFFWLCGVSMVLSAPFILAALLVQSSTAIFALMFVGLLLSMMNYGPTNTVLVNVTVPRLRAASVALNIFLIHALGDIPSPLLIGLVSDLMGKELLWGMLLTVPALVASGAFYLLGVPHLEPAQQAVLEEMQGGKQST